MSSYTATDLGTSRRVVARAVAGKGRDAGALRDRAECQAWRASERCNTNVLLLVELPNSAGSQGRERNSPQGLKPSFLGAMCGTTEVVP
jgi:hypothetical protein